MRILIKGGRIIDPSRQLDAVGDVCIGDGKVVAVGQQVAGFAPEHTIDAQDMVVCPGLIDLSVRLREPGQEHKATIDSETRAAAAGGITTVCMPPDTDPIVDSPAVLELIRQRADAAGHAHVVVLGAMTKQLSGSEITEMHALKRAGCVGISNGFSAVQNSLVLRRAMEYAASYGIKTFLVPEDWDLANGGCVHEGTISIRMGLPGIPECAESIAVSRDLLLVEQTGVSAHFCRLSSGRALSMISRARHDGLAVSADVAVHQLHLTEIDLADFNANCHVRPPLRSQRDREMLLEGLRRGAINAVCSDHQPHETSAKLLPFAETQPGVSGLETLLPLTLRAGVEAGMSLVDILALLTSGPATVLGLDRGHLAPGAVADVCVFREHERWRMTPETTLSKGKNSPFMHWEMQGRVQHTLLAGKPVFSLQAEPV